MRRAREELGLDLNALEQRTRVRVHLLSAVEDGRFEELPRGVYARAVVRAYASAVGLDPNRAVTALAHLLPESEDPLDGIARVRGFERHAEPAASALLHGGHSHGAPADPAHTRPHAAPAPPAAAASPLAPLDVARSTLHLAHSTLHAARRTWDGARRTSREARRLSDTPARHAAAAIDGVVLSAIGLVLLALTAWTAGVPIAALFDFAAPALALLFILIVALYFLLLGGVLGATVGTHLMHLTRGTAAAPESVQAVCGRAWDVAARELSILVDVLLPAPARRPPGGTPGANRSERRWEDRAAAR